MEFAFSICSDYGCCMKLYNGKMIIYDQTAYERKASRFTLNKSDLGDDSTYNFTRSVSKVYDSVKFQYQNKKGKNITYNYNIPGRTGRRTLFISSSADSHADAEKKAKAQLASTLREAITASFTVMGDPKYRACRVFRVTGFGKFNGRYFIDKVTHNFSDEGYTSTIECHKCVTNIR
ncbi:MAG: phage late control D family protein [Butyribacter sp.]